jgi:hypothetical protein
LQFDLAALKNLGLTLKVCEPLDVIFKMVGFSFQSFSAARVVESRAVWPWLRGESGPPRAVET